MKNKIVIIGLVIIVFIIGILTTFFVIKNNKELEKKKELEKLKQEANEVLNDYVDILLKDHESVLSSDLYGYVFILEKGDGVVDYLYIVNKIGRFNEGIKVNFNPINFTVKFIL